MEEEARCFLGKFVDEFPAALEEGSPLPVSPLSRKVSLEELHGESLELGLRLLAARGAPAILSALLCQAALSQLLQNDLSPFHCPQEAEANQEEEQRVVLLQSEAVQRLFLNKLIDLALAWHQTFLKLPPSTSRFRRCSVHAIKNTRRKMEDKHLALAEFNQLFGIQDGVERAYYAVFDGHGGVDAATYAATHLHVALSKQETLQSDASTAFKNAFQNTDDIFRAKAKREVLKQHWSNTLNTLVSDDLHLNRYTHWCDFDQKPYVSGDADCSTTQLFGDEDYVLLACDGFFDAVRPSMVPHLVLDALQQPGDTEGEGATPQKQSEEITGLRVAQQLVSHAKAAGSSDNITVMLVFLRPLEQLLSQDSSTETTQATQDSTSQDAPQQ
ncbi:protein phosphatase 1F isoform X2 [Xiphias gladius]|uniref:protein phosphatase 1F isoform X2 n=1 Tax=Xiphias gladius TaxID=8245 RepID=UPI001A9967FA|nr:protein phosphatase 1F isoform X2 [Xiphias gladius]